MSGPFPAVLLTAGIITAVVLIAVLLLIVPARVSFSFRSSGSETKGILTGSWLIFGLEVLARGKDPELSVMAGGARLVTRPLSSLVAPGKKYTGGHGPGQVTGIISSLLRLQGPLLALVLDLARHTRFDYARGTARIGLGDPCATGMLYGLYRAVIPLLPLERVNLTMVPEFGHEACEVDITARFQVTYPLLVLVNAVRVVKHPATRKVMNSMRAKNPGDVTA